MKKSGAERAIRSLASKWFNSVDPRPEHPSYWQLKDWCQQNGYGGYFDFRSVGGADFAAEMWFDQELGQTWRN